MPSMLFKTKETVVRETPAASATSLAVALLFIGLLLTRFAKTS